MKNMSKKLKLCLSKLKLKKRKYMRNKLNKEYIIDILRCKMDNLMMINNLNKIINQ